MKDSTAHWGTCSNDECLTSIVIYPHPEAHRDIPDAKAWDSPRASIDCPVCGVDMNWGGTDHPRDIIKNYPS